MVPSTTSAEPQLATAAETFVHILCPHHLACHPGGNAAALLAGAGLWLTKSFTCFHCLLKREFPLIVSTVNPIIWLVHRRPVNN